MKKSLVMYVRGGGIIEDYTRMGRPVCDAHGRWTIQTMNECNVFMSCGYCKQKVQEREDGKSWRCRNCKIIYSDLVQKPDTGNRWTKSQIGIFSYKETRYAPEANRLNTMVLEE